jgi:tetratricopeptide (TPR) repeat protein
MDAARWQRLQDRFLALREDPPEERERALRSLAEEDPEMAAELRSLLEVDDAPGLLDAPSPSLSELLDEPLPERIGPYVVAGEIGRGGMGVVCRAYDPRLRRDVALKLLPRALVHDRSARERFMTEARAASALDHPHICTVYDIGELEDGRLYLAMALYGRGTLADRLATGRLDAREAARVALQVASALAAAHRAGIVHRDVKPRNIAFGEDGEARLLDFGIAVLGSAAEGTADSTAGTPAYMAPEQVRGEPVDRRVDVWSLGVVLYEMLTGRRPFAGEDRAALLDAIVRGEPPDVRSLAPHVPRRLAEVVRRALAKDPADRYDGAAEVQRALESALPSRASGRAAVRANASGRTLVVAGSLAALTALSGVGVLLMRSADGDARGSGADDLDASALVVLPFRVTGDSALSYLREGMVDLLAARLTGEGGLRAVDTRTVHNAWRRSYGERSADLPADSAVRFARGLGAGSVLLGDVIGGAGGLVVNASVLDADARTVGRASAQGSHGSLPDLVDRLVGQLLSTSAREDPQRLAALTSTSLPALRAYLEGQAAYRRGRYEEALLRFNHALEYDSTFALAGLGLAFAGGWTSGAESLRARGFDVAWRHRERLSERDRALLVANVGPEYPRPSSVRQLIDATERALAMSPDRVELWYELGDRYFHFGKVIGSERWDAQAESALRRALELEPEFGPALHHLVALHALRNEPDELRRVVAAYLSVDSGGATADYVRWRAARALNEPALADGVLIDSMDVEVLGWIAMQTVDEGVAPGDGLDAARVLAERPGTNPQRFERLLGLHSFAVNAGSAALAARAAEELRAVQPEPAFVDRLNVLAALYGDGDTAVARASAGALARLGDSPITACVLELWRLEQDGAAGSSGTPPRGASAAPADASSPASAFGAGIDDAGGVQRTLCEAVLAATREVRERGAAGARVQALDSILRDGPISGPMGDGHTEYPHVALARLLERAGDRAGALAAASRRLYFIGWNHYAATSLREEAQLAQSAGERERALRAWRQYLALRGSAEPSLAAFTEAARAAVARLETETARPERP